MEHELSFSVEDRMADECWALGVWLRAYFINPTFLLIAEQKSIICFVVDQRTEQVLSISFTCHLLFCPSIYYSSILFTRTPSVFS